MGVSATGVINNDWFKTNKSGKVRNWLVFIIHESLVITISETHFPKNIVERKVLLF